MEWALDVTRGSLRSLTVEPLTQGGLAGRLFRAELAWRQGRDLPRSLIVKLSPLGDEWRIDPALSSMLLREVRFYRELGSDPGVRVPSVLHAALDDASVTTVLVMEDLATDVMYRPGEAPVAAVEEAARCAARLHARHWSATGPEWLARFGAREGAEWANRAAPAAIHAIADTHPDLVPLVGAWPDALAVGALTPMPRTVVHGDLGLRNIAFRGDAPVVFDWQQVGLADPAYDVLQLVNEAADGSDPTLIAERVFAAYLDEWQAIGDPSYGAADFHADAAKAVVLRAGTVILRIATAPVRTRGHDEVLSRWLGLLRWWRDRYGLLEIG